MKKETGKVLFSFNVDNAIDIITNSSSELFILEANSKEIVEEMLTSAVPEWRQDYQLEKLVDADNDNLETYVREKYNSWSNTLQGCEAKLIPGFTASEMFVKDEGGWRGGWKLKPHDGEQWGMFVHDGNRDKVLQGVDPLGQIWLLWSLDENPNWDDQKELMEIAERHHLG